MLFRGRKRTSWTRSRLRSEYAMTAEARDARHWRLSCLAFAGAATLHNLEELLTYRAWIASGAAPFPDNCAAGFPVALALFTALLWIVSLAAMRSQAGRFSHHCVSALALGILINAFVPHLTFSLYRFAYAPGLATAILLNIPICLLLLGRALRSGRVSPRSLVVFSAVALPLLVAGIAATLALMA